MTRTDDNDHLLTRKNVLKRLMVNHEISIFGTHCQPLIDAILLENKGS